MFEQNGILIERRSTNNPAILKHLEQNQALVNRLKDGILVIDDLIEDARQRLLQPEDSTVGDDDLISIAKSKISDINLTISLIENTIKSLNHFKERYYTIIGLENSIQTILSWAVHQDALWKGLRKGRYSAFNDNKPTDNGNKQEDKIIALIEFVELQLHRRKEKIYFLGRYARNRILRDKTYTGDHRFILHVEINIARCEWETESIIAAINALNGVVNINSITHCVLKLIKLDEPRLITTALLASRVFTDNYQKAMIDKDMIAKKVINDETYLLMDKEHAKKQYYLRIQASELTNL